METFIETLLLLLAFTAFFNGAWLTIGLNIGARRSVSNFFLSLLIFGQTLMALSLVANFFDWQTASSLLGFGMPILFLGPLVWLYMNSLFGFPQLSRKSILFHILGLGAFIGISLLIEFVFASYEKEVNIVLTIAEDLYSLVYLISGYVLFRRNAKGWDQVHSTHPQWIQWAKILVMLYGLVVCYSLMQGFLASFGISVPRNIDGMSLLFESLLIQIVGVFLFIHPVILTGRIGSASREKYGTGRVSDREAAGFLKQLNGEMDKTKPYLDPDLTLVQLADAVGLSGRILSQLINDRLGSNFYQYVNSYRIKEAETLLLSSDKSVLDIAFEAGFNSKTTFNVTFKKMNGKTPTQFRRDSE